MQKHIFILFLFIIFFFVISCTKEITLNFEHKPKLTFNCILNPDSTIKANLSFSRALGGMGDFIPAKNAKIKLFENDELLGELKELGNGVYSLQYYPKPGSTYFVQINVIGHSVLNASTTVPNRTKIEFVPIPPKPEDIYKKVDVRIHDPISKNYYWNYSYNIGKEEGTIYYSSTYGWHFYSPLYDDFNREVEADSKYGFIYFYMLRIKDDSNNGEILHLEAYSENSTHYYGYDIYLETDSCYDRYLKTTVQIRMLENEEIPMCEPVQIFSNVENGYGIFGSCIKTVRKF